MGITEFLLARIAEDEAAANAAVPEGAYPYLGDTAAEECVGMARNEGCAEAGAAHLDRWLPTRVLAECEAKRRIVELWSDDARWPDFDGGFEVAIDGVVKILAAVYADHPDYRQEWAL